MVVMEARFRTSEASQPLPGTRWFVNVSRGCRRTRMNRKKVIRFQALLLCESWIRRRGDKTMLSDGGFSQGEHSHHASSF